MKLVKQQKLHFQDEKSDKIYEVELFHLQEDEYIVNFRYGRRGKRMTEGTKTVFPVPKASADKVFDDLVASKTKKGYREVTTYEGANPASPISSPAETFGAGAITQIMDYLRQMAEGAPPPIKWKRSRIIWRAGELKITKASTHIAALLPKLKDQDLYSAIWYLGRIANAQCREILQTIHPVSGDKWERIHTAALVRCNDQKTIQEIIDSLPVELSDFYQKNEVQEYFKQLNHYLFKAKVQQVDCLLSTYYLSLIKESFKAPLLLTLSMIQLKPNYWKYVRYIYKLAEMLEDEQTFALLSGSVQKNESFFNNNSWGWIYLDGERIGTKKELTKANSKIAYSQRTRVYFINRTLRRLRQAGQDRQEWYCALATEMLTNHTEQDRIEHAPEYKYEYDNTERKYKRIRQDYHTLAHIPYLYYILFSSGERLKISALSKFYFKDGVVEQTEREEAFGTLWDQYPQYAVKLLIEGRLKEGSRLAMNVLKGRSDLSDLIDSADLKALVSHPFSEVLEFSLEIVKQQYDAAKPDVELIIALIHSGNDRAIDLVINLIAQNNTPFITDIDFVKSALITNHTGLQTWLRANITEQQFSASENQDIVENTLLYYKSLEEGQLFESTVDSLLHCFKNYLYRIDSQYIIDLLESEKVQVQLLAGKLINANNIPLADLPEEIIAKMLSSSNEAIRAQGLDLLAKLTDKDLVQKKDLMIALAASPLEDLRLRGRELIGRMAKIDLAFRDSVFERLYPLLMENYEEEKEDIPQDIWETIAMHLSESIPLILPEIETVLKDNHRETHLMTAHLLAHQANLDQWPVAHIALMGNHDMKSIRETAYQYYTEHVDRIQYEKESAIKIFNTEWAETLDFSYTFFDENFSDKEWNPDLIIALCDNVRPKVQDYGTRLLGKYFKGENGVKYLTELSEHPAAAIQLYTTNYLDRYAFSNEAILIKLEPYFRTILSSINQKSAAKQRVFHFLSKQAEAGEVYGLYVANILKDLVGTIAILDKEKYILLLRKIERNYKIAEARVEVLPVEVRQK